MGLGTLSGTATRQSFQSSPLPGPSSARAFRHGRQYQDSIRPTRHRRQQRDQEPPAPPATAAIGSRQSSEATRDVAESDSGAAHWIPLAQAGSCGEASHRRRSPSLPLFRASIVVLDTRQERLELALVLSDRSPVPAESIHGHSKLFVDSTADALSVLSHLHLSPRS